MIQTVAPTTDEELKGEALDARVAELGIDPSTGGSNADGSLSADEKRRAIAAKEAEAENDSDDEEPDDLDDDEEDEDVPSPLDELAEHPATNNIDPETGERLEHTQGGITTRDDANDQGVEMLQGDATERVGPEDALGVGPKRGDYERRALPNLEAHEVVRDESDGAGQPTTNDDGGVDIKPHSVLQSQVGRMTDQGEVPGEKGGVDTDPRS